jgi:2-keto-4-pentenoate hydratase/2-oxohepta-3-ene-1,7-dioic acid hydratase in catechol pathway
MRTITLILAVVVTTASGPPGVSAQDHEGPVSFVRYEYQGRTSYGVLDGDRILRIEGDLYGEHALTETVVDLSAVELLPPSDPKKVIAVGLNYRSHIGNREPAAYPGLFAKYPTSLVGHEADIIRPEGAGNLHYEGELVLVIGKRAKDVSESEALDYVFGVTGGNDISERDWQSADLQWFRAKASDTFGPVGPTVTVGLDPDDLLVQTRVNGEVRQTERTSDLIFGTAAIVSYVSRYVTLEPGDLIFTGTPQTTRAMEDGDIVEVEIEGVGVLRNRVVSAQGR